jgi:3-deoxy-D-manno-octulosonic-acid transferase
MHCASVGEVSLARPLAARLVGAHPGLDLFVTTLTRAGRESAERAFPGSRVCYFPLDLTPAVRRALTRVAPVGVVLVELEVWPNFLGECRVRGIPVAIVNGRMTERSLLRYRLVPGLFRRLFRGLAAVGVQNEAYAERLRVVGARPRVTGNMKYDAAIAFEPGETEREWRVTLGLGDAPVLVAGSTHEPEERILVETFKRLQATFPRLRLVLAPRHLHRVPEVAKVVEAAGLPCYKKSSLQLEGPADGVLLLDTVGELSRAYSVATAVFIGGTLCGRGGQNMLEPAALGKPIVSGPSVSNFEDIARALVEAGAMKVLDNPIEIALALGELLRSPERAREVGARAREAVRAGRGAIDGSVELIEEHVLKGR